MINSLLDRSGMNSGLHPKHSIIRRGFFVFALTWNSVCCRFFGYFFQVPVLFDFLVTIFHSLINICFISGYKPQNGGLGQMLMPSKGNISLKSKWCKIWIKCIIYIMFIFKLFLLQDTVSVHRMSMLTNPTLKHKVRDKNQPNFTFGLSYE